MNINLTRIVDLPELRIAESKLAHFYDRFKHKPETTFGTVKADVLADKDPPFTRGNFCSVIRGSAWRG